VDTVRRRVLDILAERPNVRNPRAGSGCAYVADPFSAWEDGTPHAPRCVVGEYLVRFAGWTDADFAASENDSAEVLIGDDLPADVVAVLQSAQEGADGTASRWLEELPPLWGDACEELEAEWGMA
jgi:hypothetical protein